MGAGDETVWTSGWRLFGETFWANIFLKIVMTCDAPFLTPQNRLEGKYLPHNHQNLGEEINGKGYECPGSAHITL